MRTQLRCAAVPFDIDSYSRSRQPIWDIFDALYALGHTIMSQRRLCGSPNDSAVYMRINSCRTARVVSTGLITMVRLTGTYAYFSSILIFPNFADSFVQFAFVGWCASFYLTRTLVRWVLK